MDIQRPAQDAIGDLRSDGLALFLRESGIQIVAHGLFLAEKPIGKELLVLVHLRYQV